MSAVISLYAFGASAFSCELFYFFPLLFPGNSPKLFSDIHKLVDVAALVGYHTGNLTVATDFRNLIESFY